MDFERKKGEIRRDRPFGIELAFVPFVFKNSMN